MKSIELTRGKCALVDDSDFASLSRWKWYAQYYPKADKWYAQRTENHPNGRNKTIKMHRFIMSAPSGTLVDHRDGDGLNNTRSNIRASDHRQNSWNRPLTRSNKSGFKGVHFIQRLNKWRAVIQVFGHKRHLGLFTNAEMASNAYKAAALQVQGEFAHAR